MPSLFILMIDVDDQDFTTCQPGMGLGAQLTHSGGYRQWIGTTNVGVLGSGDI
jgi:hypothetical protein